jgi:hypothetical protein
LDVFATAPELKWAYLSSTDQSKTIRVADLSLPWSNITHFECNITECYPKEDLKVLRRLLSLSYATFGRWQDSIGSMGDMSLNAVIAALDLDTVHLPNLRTAQIQDYCLVSTLRLPNLVELDINGKNYPPWQQDSHGIVAGKPPSSITSLQPLTKLISQSRCSLQHLSL